MTKARSKPALSAKEMIKGARRPEKVTPICLRGDLQVEFEAAEKALVEAMRPADSLAGNGPVAEIVARIEALQAEMSEHTLQVRMRGLPRPEWKDLIAAHPPRRAEDNTIDERDKYVGLNMDSFFPAMIRACTVSPEMDDDDWELLLGPALTDAQFDALSDAAWGLNRSDVSVPFSRVASQIAQTSASA